MKQAERLLRQGQLAGAIAEYVRLTAEHPRDWASCNALGDLYLRAGDMDRAAAQFTRVADFHLGEGFFSKAAALYRKALKATPDHEPTRLRLSEVAARQGLLADARHHLRQVERQRSARGDVAGAAECKVRLALLEDADADTRLAGARAARTLGDAPRAAGLFRTAAAALADAGREAERIEALVEAAALDPADAALRRELVRVGAGDSGRVAHLLTRASAGDSPDLLLMLGRFQLDSGHDSEARAALTRLIAVAPDRAGDLLALAGECAAAGHPGRGFLCAEIVADDALLAGDWDRAVNALRAFLRHGPHVPALIKLVELAVDGDRDEVLQAAQAQLADAYLAAGLGAEARGVAEDLMLRDPASAEHAARLRQALALLGIADADAIVERYRDRGAASLFGAVLDTPGGAATERPVSEPAADRPVSPAPFLDLSTRVVVDRAGPDAAAAAPAPPGPDDDAIVLDVRELDLTDLLAGMTGADPVEPAPPAPAAAPPPDLEAVFESMRAKVAQEQRAPDAEEEYQRALGHIERGEVGEAAAALRSAARAPHLRFAASARLGRLVIAAGDALAGIDWLERAAEAPAPTPEDGAAVLYDLADVLEQVGEPARALAVLMELAAHGTGFRDVRERIEQLVRAQGGGRRA